jgi:hypothetical protein
LNYKAWILFLREKAHLGLVDCTVEEKQSENIHCEENNADLRQERLVGKRGRWNEHESILGNWLGALFSGVGDYASTATSTYRYGARRL